MSALTMRQILERFQLIDRYPFHTEADAQRAIEEMYSRRGAQVVEGINGYYIVKPKPKSK